MIDSNIDESITKRILARQSRCSLVATREPVCTKLVSFVIPSRHYSIIPSTGELMEKTAGEDGDDDDDDYEDEDDDGKNDDLGGNDDDDVDDDSRNVRKPPLLTSSRPHFLL